jgi:hypothetical protein
LRLTGTAGLGLAVSAWPASRAQARPEHLWGAYVQPRSGQDARQAVRAFERMIGRHLGVTRHYAAWDLDLPTAFIDWSASRGRIPYISLHAWTTKGERIPWSDIAAGNWDQRIQAQAQGLKAAGYPVIFCFHHEPENDTANGTAADFKAASTRVLDIFASAGVDNARYVVNLTHNTYDGMYGGPDAWMPPRFTWVGVDGYNRWPCFQPENRSFRQLFANAQAYAERLGKRLFIGEVGTLEATACGGDGDPMAKARWIRRGMRAAHEWNVAGVVYSHTGPTFNGQVMDYWVDSSTASLNAYRRAGHSAFFGG